MKERKKKSDGTFLTSVGGQPDSTKAIGRKPSLKKLQESQDADTLALYASQEQQA